ncbi:MAG TPA: hypothetical protein DCO73_08575 [Alphaproteobacteria bacterium]|nr:hypothetical protein [Alphaproteobacteria bacterium]
MKKKITWIVVADGAHASIFQNDGPGKGITPTRYTQLTGDTRRSSEIASDGPGKTHSRGGHVQSAMEPSSDPHEQAAQDFIAHIADLLSNAHKAQEFERLILVAPPQALGDLRAALPADVSDLVSGELHKDLTHATIPDITEHLGDVLAV